MKKRDSSTLRSSTFVWYEYSICYSQIRSSLSMRPSIYNIQLPVYGIRCTTLLHYTTRYTWQLQKKSVRRLTAWNGRICESCNTNTTKKEIKKKMRLKRKEKKRKKREKLAGRRSDLIPDFSAIFQAAYCLYLRSWVKSFLGKQPNKNWGGEKRKKKKRWSEMEKAKGERQIENQRDSR